jgi:hypothetical protein
LPQDLPVATILTKFGTSRQTQHVSKRHLQSRNSLILKGIKNSMRIINSLPYKAKLYTAG